ncbi:hypothetical protein K470DRAFT_234148 [Piedraia hortae CBS 480.64]|uniref:Uncharacterized protein n=1 Tax=Piedraia hortae CBS 480.64 TaxID=1314780 RepID=A0A6A7BWI8_9PEZI|nr:hypothetical protein K470DRAFT_234148 [Piedraia hortae CBS 480.64]
MAASDRLIWQGTASSSLLTALQTTRPSDAGPSHRHRSFPMPVLLETSTSIMKGGSQVSRAYEGLTWMYLHSLTTILLIGRTSD